MRDWLTGATILMVVGALCALAWAIIISIALEVVT